MPERKTLITITQVTDDDTGMYYIGEPDGLFQRDELTEYLKAHGQKGKRDLHEHIAYLQNQIIESWRNINLQDHNENDIGSNAKSAL